MTHIPRILIAAQDHDVCNFIQVALAPHGFMLQFLMSDVPIPDALAQIAADALLIETANLEEFEQYAAIKQHCRRRSTPILLLMHEMDDKAEGDDIFLLPGSSEDLVLRVQALLHHTASECSDSHSPTKPMLRGFVHEISNTATSNMLVLVTAFDNEKTLCVQNAEYLQQLFDLIEPTLPRDIREQALDYLNRIDQNEEALDRALRLVNNANDRIIGHTKRVSEYSKLEYLPMRIQPLMLDRELAAVLKQYQERFDEHDITVTIDGTCTQPFYGHRPHIHALFEHLLTNAYEAFVACAPASPPGITVTFSNLDDTHRIRIHDNAGGIQPIHLPEVFEPFYTTHPKTNAGLGLCFAAKLMSLYGGSITLENIAGDGTCAELLFPMRATSSSHFPKHA